MISFSSSEVGRQNIPSIGCCYRPSWQIWELIVAYTVTALKTVLISTTQLLPFTFRLVRFLDHTLQWEKCFPKNPLDKWKERRVLGVIVPAPFLCTRALLLRVQTFPRKPSLFSPLHLSSCYLLLNHHNCFVWLFMAANRGTDLICRLRLNSVFSFLHWGLNLRQSIHRHRLFAAAVRLFSSRKMSS